MSDPAIETLDPDDPEVVALIDLADAYYAGLYPAESNHLVSRDELRGDNLLFVGCRVDGALAATGAAKRMDDDGVYAEIKRVYVLEAMRGRGLSRRIMAYLEAAMGERGIDCLRLETGISQPEALALYRVLGYRERAPFGAYREDPLSVFMEKRLAD